MKHGNSQNGKLPVFRDRLRSLQGDLTTTAFAEKLGLSRQTTGFYINGDRIPDIQTLQQICEKCNVSADYLLGLSDITSQDANTRSVAAYTGLTERAIDNLKSMRSANNGKNRIGQLSKLLEDTMFSFSLLDRIFQHRQKYIEFLTAYKQRKQELDTLHEKTGGDVAKETQLYQDGYPRVSVTLETVAELHDQSDVTQFRAQKVYNSIMSQIDKECEMAILGYLLKNAE